MNAKHMYPILIAALLVPAFAAGQTRDVRANEMSVAPMQVGAQALPLTGDMQSDLALASAVQDEKPEAQSVLQTEPKKKPIVAGLMSLAVPGAGQVYAGSYVRAGIYLAAEIAGITAAVIYNNKGDNKTDEFQTYADAHWSAVKYAQYLNTYAGKYRENKDNANIAIDPNTALPSWRRVSFDAINAYEGGNWIEGFSHKLPKHGEQQYYELIGKYDQFKYGWDTYPVQANGLPADDTGIYNDVPQQLKDYAAERGKANDFYSSSRLAVSLVLINHMVSAVDAYLTARHYNASLSSNMSMERVGERMVPTSTVTLAIGL